MAAIADASPLPAHLGTLVDRARFLGQREAEGSACPHVVQSRTICPLAGEEQHAPDVRARIMTGALTGMRVLDLTRALAGPFCTMLLGDFGADVVKAEATPEGDMCRGWGPFEAGEGLYFLSINRNKRSIALDFSSPRGIELLQRLAAQADIVVDNYRPGVMRALGLDRATLARANPKIITCSISGLGASGPHRDRPGYDQIAQGLAGLMSVTGLDAVPTRVGIPIADLLGGIFGALGVMAAVVQCNATGAGCEVETSLLEALVGIMCFQGQKFLTHGAVATSAGNDHPLIAAYGIFEAGDGPFNIGCANDKQWLRLCAVLGLDFLARDPDFADNTLRMQHRERMRSALNERLRTRAQNEWVELLNAEGIACGAINTMDRVLTDPQVLARDMVLETIHPLIGSLKLLGAPVKVGGRAQVINRAPPLLGEHSAEVLGELGYTASGIAELFAANVLQSRSASAAPVKAST
ncbi:MAG: CoA transferase [Candidatus Velthaea sp.]